MVLVWFLRVFRACVGYWSSIGSPDPASSEWIGLRVVHPLCLLREIQIRPYKAYFQMVNLNP